MTLSADVQPPSSPDPERGTARRGPIRVASVPASHVYVRHLADPDDPSGVHRLPDVRPRDGRTVPGGWWPPLMLDPDWVRENAQRFDVFHVHFGFDAKTPTELRAVAAALRQIDVPLVVTVHDLRNPHHADRALHDAQLGVLLEAADAVLTLTPGAAAEIRARWGRRARVVPHPHVVEPGRMRRPRVSRPGFVVGMHAKSVRANMDPVRVARELASIVGDIPGGTLRVDLHDELLDPGAHDYAPDVAGDLIALGYEHDRVDVRVHPYFGDDELWDYLAGLDVSVLPYRFGTHSGWLEACVDLGTAVVAPDRGFYAEQGPCHVYRCADEGPDVASLRRAVLDACAARASMADDAVSRDARVRDRLRQRRTVAAVHRRVYAELVGDDRPVPASSGPGAAPLGRPRQG